LHYTHKPFNILYPSIHFVHLLSLLEHYLQLAPQAEQAIPKLMNVYHQSCIHLSSLNRWRSLCMKYNDQHSLNKLTKMLSSIRIDICCTHWLGCNLNMVYCKQCKNLCLCLMKSCLNRYYIKKHPHKFCNWLSTLNKHYRLDSMFTSMSSSLVHLCISDNSLSNLSKK
jgi:hypothetical protein